MNDVQKPTPQEAYEAAYLDKKRFPLTTQGNLTAHYQRMIDAVNKDDIIRMREEERPVSPELEARWREYEEKAKLTRALAYETAYLDAKRFPLTTQGNLTFEKQKMIDAVNMDDMRRMLEEGRPLNAEQQAIAKEFEEKAKLSKE